MVGRAEADTTQRSTKLEPAERQLVVAIRLFFDRGDPVAIQTLASASARILRDSSRKRGIPVLIDELIVPEHRKEAMRVDSFVALTLVARCDPAIAPRGWRFNRSRRGCRRGPDERVARSR